MIDLKPKNWKDLIGNGTAIDKIKRWLPKNNLLIHGDSGIGKTSSIHVWADKNGHDIFEVNASDNRDLESLNFLKNRSRLALLKPTLFLLDEADGIQWWKHGDLVWDIILGSNHPFVLIANDPYKIKKSHESWKTKHGKKEGVIKEIRFYKPQVKTVVARLKALEKEHGVKFDFTNVSTDIRSSLNTLQTSGDKYKAELNVFDILRDLFVSSSIEQLNLTEHLIWIYENITNIYHGYDMIFAHSVLEVVNRTHDTTPLKLLPKVTYTKNIEYPNYLRRSAKARRNNSKNAKVT